MKHAAERFGAHLHAKEQRARTQDLRRQIGTLDDGRDEPDATLLQGDGVSRHRVKTRSKRAALPVRERRGLPG
jgi:hypothetical protein